MTYDSHVSTIAASRARAWQHLAEDGAATLLVVSPQESDHSALRDIFAGTNWTVHYSYTWEEARECLEEHRVSVVVCERDLPDATWRDAWKSLVRVPGAPMLVVASRLADERLWAEVLNLGGYDVILKPFEPNETKWVAGTAAWKWQQRRLERQLVC
ncbi:MAG TPA: response regulator [Bryobacteraceae bacterium]|nr:response regulator [Bryobacteraceae bacterium]